MRNEWGYQEPGGKGRAVRVIRVPSIEGHGVTTPLTVPRCMEPHTHTPLDWTTREWDPRYCVLHPCVLLTLSGSTDIHASISCIHGGVALLFHVFVKEIDQNERSWKNGLRSRIQSSPANKNLPAATFYRALTTRSKRWQWQLGHLVPG